MKLGLAGSAITDETAINLVKMPVLQSVGMQHGLLGDEALARLRVAQIELILYPP